MKLKILEVVVIILVACCIVVAKSATVTKGVTFTGAANEITPTALNQLVDNASVTNITHLDIASANKDGLAAIPSMRTLGTNATQAASGNDSRIAWLSAGGTNSIGIDQLTSSAKSNLASVVTWIPLTNYISFIGTNTASVLARTANNVNNTQAFQLYSGSYLPRYTNSTVDVSAGLWAGSIQQTVSSFLFLGSNTNAVSASEALKPGVSVLNFVPMNLFGVTNSVSTSAIPIEIRSALTITQGVDTVYVGRMQYGTTNIWGDAGRMWVKIVECPQ